MVKKRKSIGKAKTNKSQTEWNEKENLGHPRRFENRLLAFLYSAQEAVPLAIIEDLIAQEGGRAKDLANTIDSLLHGALIKKSGKRLFSLSRKAPVYEGLLIQHPKGFGFINPVHQHGERVDFSRDPFVSASSMGNAQHGDQVLIRILKIRKDLRPEAVVLDITAPGTDRVAGLVKKDGDSVKVLPDDPRFPFTIEIDDHNGFSPLDGDAVIVKYTREHRPARTLKGKILEVLGKSDQIDTQLRLVVEKFALPQTFNSEVLEETEKLSQDMNPGEHREDLRETQHITIDGETAKDFDDAICVIKTRKGFRLYVSIADVSHYVAPGSAIDREAYARGTSIYFPGRVLPMLPERLSNDLCSLVPNEDRLTVSAILEFDRSGQLLNKRFTRSVIRSQQRFTYTKVQQILIDKDPAVRTLYKDFLTPLKWAQELAIALQNKRKLRGSIDFNVPEPEFHLNESGEIAAITRTERTFAHQLIEECMLAANEAVAELATARKVSALYRIHEQPDPEKTKEFITFAQKLGLILPPLEDSAAWFSQVIDLCKDSKYDYIINNLILRSMKQARYSSDNIGHFGLASPNYTHFTSPIRRYPDLIVHRTLLSLLAQQSGRKSKPGASQSLKEAGDYLSERERTAISAERDMQERLKISYMQKHIGESFNAVISGVNEMALFLEIPEHCLSGSLAVDRLTDDYYILDSKNHRLFGEISAKVYRIGDQLRVTLTDVDQHRRRINFMLANETAL